MSSTVTVVPKIDGRVAIAKWLNLPTAAAGDPSSNVWLYADRSVQMTGTFGSSVVSSVNIQGSNDGGNTWANLKDAFGNTISMASAGIAQITEVVDQIRPNVTGGDSTTAVNVYLIMKKTVI